jgi:PST family polysaccharide transporter
MLTALVTAKMISVYLGPVGLGVIGQLNSFIVVVLGLATGSINNGVIKYVAEYTGLPIKQRAVITASVTITLTCTAILSLIIVGFHGFWSDYIFGIGNDFKAVIILFGFTLIFYSLYSLSIAIINGLQEYKKYNIINILASVLGLIFTVTLIRLGALKGALYAMVTYQSISFFIAVFTIKKQINFNVRELFVFNNKRLYISLLGFSVMSLVTTASTPMAQIYIRTFISENVSSIATGYYEAVSRISGIYLTLITTTLSVYYLPRLSALTDKKQLKHEIINGYKLIIPLLVLMSGTIYLTRYLIIDLAFTNDFSKMESYFLPQLIGDFFKIASWLLAFLMLAKAMVKLFIFTEIVFTASLIVLTHYFVGIFGGEGAVIAYCANYIFYFFTMLFVAGNYFKTAVK